MYILNLLIIAILFGMTAVEHAAASLDIEQEIIERLKNGNANARDITVMSTEELKREAEDLAATQKSTLTAPVALPDLKAPESPAIAHKTIPDKKDFELPLPAEVKEMQNSSIIEKKPESKKIDQKKAEAIQCIKKPEKKEIKNKSMITQAKKQESTPEQKAITVKKKKEIGGTPLSQEKAAEINVSPRDVYDYTSKPLPSNISKDSYSNENSHLPRAFYHSGFSKLLFAATEEDDIGAIKALLAKGANINTVNIKNGYTPLMHAINHHKHSAARYLVTRGAHLDLQANDGKTALHIAAIQDNVESFKLLLAAGAKTKITDRDNKMAFQYMKGDAMAIHLASSYSNMDEAALECSASGLLVCVKFALYHNANVNYVSPTSDTPLIAAAANGEEEIVNLLLYKGANPGYVNKRGIDATVAARNSSFNATADIIETAKINAALSGYKPEPLLIAPQSIQSVIETPLPSEEISISQPILEGDPLLKPKPKVKKPKKLTVRQYCD